MTILDRIVADTRERVARSKRTHTLERLHESPFYHSPALSLERALSKNELSFISEIKKASPSKGLIRQDYDVREIATQYKHGGAAAISVLTEPNFFKGSLDDLLAVRKSVDLPLLRKDFVVDAYQLHEARSYGADAVLLIAAVLERNVLADLHAEATELGLSCLVEVYEPAELERIDFDQVRILGVNNRNLHTFEVDIEHSLRVFEHVPAGVRRVSESGLRTTGDLAHLYRNGVDAVLVGETFMRALSPGDELRRVRSELAAALSEVRPALRLVG